MSMLVQTLTSVNSSIGYLVSILNSVSEPTTNQVAEQCMSLIIELEDLNNEIERLYDSTSSELHIFFESYNQELAENINLINYVIYEVEELEDLAMMFYELYLMELMGDGFIVVEFDIGELFNYIGVIQELNNSLELLSFNTDVHNEKLIISNRRD